LAKTLKEGIRGIDLAARIGGEEFGLLLTETSLDRATEVADRLRLAIKSLDFEAIGAITVSLGVAEAPLCAQTARELLACADAALYEGKASGARLHGPRRSSELPGCGETYNDRDSEPS